MTVPTAKLCCRKLMATSVLTRRVKLIAVPPNIICVTRRLVLSIINLVPQRRVTVVVALMVPLGSIKLRLRQLVRWPSRVLCMSFFIKQVRRGSSDMSKG